MGLDPHAGGHPGPLFPFLAMGARVSAASRLRVPGKISSVFRVHCVVQAWAPRGLPLASGLPCQHCSWWCPAVEFLGHFEQRERPERRTDSMVPTGEQLFFSTQD